MVFVNFLGTASGVPTPGRYSTSICLTVGDGGECVRYLLDCGEPATTLLQNAAIDLRSIAAIFISHMHADHVSGLFQLIQTMQVRDRDSPLELLVPEEAVQAMQEFLVATYLAPECLPFKLSITGIQPGRFYADGILRAHAFSNDHLGWIRGQLAARQVQYPRMRFQSFTLRLQLDDKTIVYSGDVHGVRELEGPLGGGCDLLVLELAHIKASDLKQWSEGLASARRIAVTHVHPNVSENRSGLARQLIDTGISAELHLVEDGSTLILR